MTSSDGPGDPTMDEILASIRKIIADEPIGSRPLPEQRLKTVAALAEARGSGNGTTGSTGSVSPLGGSDRAAPGYSRLADAIRNGTMAGGAQRPQPRPVAKAIDDDLADLLEGSPLVREERPRSAESPIKSGPAASPASPLDAPWPLREPLGGEPRLDARNPTVSAPGQAPERPAGDRETSQSPLGLSALRTARAEPSVTPTQPMPALSEGARAFVADSGKPLDIGAIVPGLMNLATPPPKPVAPAPAEMRPEPNVPGSDVPELRPEAGPAAAAGAGTKSPILAAAEAAQAIAAKLETKMPEAKKSEPDVIAAMPVHGASAAKAAATPDSGSTLQPSPRVAEKDAARPGDATAVPVVDLETSAAAASALGALAAGLAATRARTDVAPPPPAEPAKVEPKAEVGPLPELPTSVCSVPDFFIHGVTQRNPRPKPAQPEADASGAVLRSLEDTVAELLRPMLRQWLADNMPRIVEKALRIEVAESLKPGAKRPGS